MKKVAVIMGSDSDWPVVKGACQQLETFGIPYEAHILLSLIHISEPTRP